MRMSVNRKRIDHAIIRFLSCISLQFDSSQKYAGTPADWLSKIVEAVVGQVLFMIARPRTEVDSAEH